MDETPVGLYVLHSDHKKAMDSVIEEDRDELVRLQENESAARDILAELENEGYSGFYKRKLVEACGRKGG